MNLVKTKSNEPHSCAPFANKQHGVALIVVLLIVALVAILATQMTSRLQLNVARTTNIKDNNQAYWYALGAEQYARKSLRVLLNANLDNINLTQAWAEPFSYPIENGLIQAQLTDMQTCFNINALLGISTGNEESGDAPAGGAGQIEQEAKPEDPNDAGKSQEVLALEDLLTQYIEDSLVLDTLRDSIIDWIDEDDFSQPYGAEDIEYESLPQPYLAANAPLSHLSELRLIKGFDEGLRQGWSDELLKQVCVLPEMSFKININTLEEKNAPTLAALTGLSVDDAMQIISSRPIDGYTDINSFLSESLITGLEMSSRRNKWFDVTTKYFKLTTKIEMLSGAEFTLVTVFHLDNNDIKIVSREIGGV